MAQRRRKAKAKLPDRAGLAHDHVRVGYTPGDQEDPWGSAITKTWADSFADPDDQCVPDPSQPNGPDYWFTVELPDVDFDVQVRLGRTDENAFVVTGLLLGDPGGTQAITTSNLHRLPIGAIYEAIGRLEDATTMSALAEKAKRFRGAVPTRGGQRSSDDLIVEAANVYKKCLRDRPNDTIKCVAERLGVSGATASRRVTRARELGLLREPDPALLGKLELPRPEELEDLEPGMKHVRTTAKAVYADRHRRAWMALDYLQRAIDDDRENSNPISKHVVESRSRQFQQDFDDARHQLDVLLALAREEPPF